MQIADAVENIQPFPADNEFHFAQTMTTF